MPGGPGRDPATSGISAQPAPRMHPVHAERPAQPDLTAPDLTVPDRPGPAFRLPEHRSGPERGAPVVPDRPAEPEQHTDGPTADGPHSERDGRGLRPDPAASVAVTGCTAPQLRRFIKSRPYVPMHELRRRFGINGTEDDVSSIDLGGHRVYVGLPAREGSLLGELLRGGDIGYELSLDPRTPIVIGLYPMRPVARS